MLCSDCSRLYKAASGLVLACGFGHNLTFDLPNWLKFEQTPAERLAYQRLAASVQVPIIKAVINIGLKWYQRGARVALVLTVFYRRFEANQP